MEAADCLEEAVAGSVRRGDKIPAPSKREKGEMPVPVPLQTTTKAALLLAMLEAGVSKVDLARQLHIDEQEVRRILDPHGTRLPAMERALSILGKHAELRIS